jgi:nucleoside-triphosphatase
MASRHTLLLTGPPGVGKTTLLRRVAIALRSRRIAGFTTEEIREGGRRVGFRITPLSGPGRVMAHVALRSSERIGRYGVDVTAIDATVAAVLSLDPNVDLYLIDEIGKMECCSSRFVTAVRALLDSDQRAVATVAQKGGGFIAEVKGRADVELWSITAGNRDVLVDRVVAWANPD